MSFSFGLKKSAPPKKLAFSTKPSSSSAFARKPPVAAPFGGDDDDDDDDTTTPNSAPKAVAIIELDGFEINAPAIPADESSNDRKKPSRSKKSSAPPAPPSTKPAAKHQLPATTAAALQFDDLSSALDSRRHAQAATETDPTIYDYDAVYDSLKAAAAAAKKEDDEAGAAEQKRPKYFDALQKAADVRERDRQIAEEKRLKRERDAEGDEFADKEKFVTEAYKRQQEANRKLEEEEARREEEERKRNKNRGMADFYKTMLDRGEEEHRAQVKAVEEWSKNGGGGGDGGAAHDGAKKQAGEDQEKQKSATERAREINAMGGNVIINDDGEVVDKRQLLRGGLNVAPKKKMEVQQEKARGQQHQQAGARLGGSTKGVFAGPGGKSGMRERQTRMLEAQLEETLKRSREEEEAERAKVELVAKSKKTDADISSAKERYLARKRAAEEAKKNGTADGP